MGSPVRRGSFFILPALLCCLLAKAEAQLPPPAISFTQSYSSNSVNYLPGDALVAISVPGGEGATVYYSLAGEPTPENVQPYGGPLTLPEGGYAFYAVADWGGGIYTTSSAAIHVDATAPQTTLEIAGIGPVAPEADGFIHIGPYSNVALLPADAASGVGFTACLVDVPPEACGAIGTIISTMPAGTCQNYLYYGPFSLAIGTHTVYYMSVDNVGNEEVVHAAPLAVGGEAGLGGVITTPELPEGAQVTVVVSTDQFRSDPVGFFPFAAQGTSLSYNFSLPGPVTYYLAAFAGPPAEDLVPGTPIGVYGAYSPVFARPGAVLGGLDFSIAADLEPPLVAVLSPADGSSLEELGAITGTAADNTGVDSIYAAIEDVSTGLWLDPEGGLWISTAVTPLFGYAGAVFSGPPASPAWSIAASGDNAGILSRLAARLAHGNDYKLYLRVKDFTSTPSQQAVAGFTWTGAQGSQVYPGRIPELAGQAEGTSGVAWSWPAVIGADGYAVYSDTGVFLSSVTETAFLRSGLGPNASGAVCVAAYNAYGAGVENCSAAVYTLAAVPGIPETVAASSYSLTLLWSPGGNPAGTTYDLNGSLDDFQGGSSTSVLVGSGEGDVSVAVPGLFAGATYYLRVRAINAGGAASAYSGSASTRTFNAPPEPPASLTAVYDPAELKTRLFWSPAASGVPAVLFRVHRAEEPSPGVFSVLGLAPYAAYEEPALRSATFYYAVSALNSDGVEGAFSEPLRVVVDADPPAAVADLEVSSYSAAAGTAVLSWTAPYDNAALGQYLIKAGYSPVNDGNWGESVIVGTAAAAGPPGAAQSYALAASSTETLKFFAVKAFDAAGNASPVSNPAVLDLLPPAVSTSSALQDGAVVTRPFFLRVEAADNHLIERIDFLVDGALAGSLPVAAQTFTGEHLWDIGAYPDGNHVFAVAAHDRYGNTAEKQFAVLINYNPPAAPVIGAPPAGFSIHGSTVDVSGAAEAGTYVSIFVNDAFVTSAEAGPAGTFYAQAVPLGGDGAVSIAAQAVDAHGASPRSAPVAGVVDTGPPGAPSALEAQPEAQGKVALAWAAPEGEVPASYNLYRSASETGLAEGAAAPGAGPALGALTALNATDAPSPDGVYYYAAAAVDAAVNISTLSNVAAAVSDSQPPTAALALPGATPPLGAGRYPVTLTVSEVLSATPYLVFTPENSSPAQLALEASTPYLWVGTLTVTQAMPSGAGVFSFQGVDLTGNAGGGLAAGAALELMTEGPAAAVSFDPPAGPALKAGSYTVRLALSHAAVSPPVFSFSVAAGSVTVALSSAASAAAWSGTLVVAPAAGEGARNFSYSALDALGNTGTLLEGATYFIADTVAPGAPVSPHWSLGAGGIVNLTWSAPMGEKPAAYCVYRDAAPLTCSVLPGTADQTGAYSEIPAEGAHDYYMTALDAAGNESAPTESLAAVSDKTPPAAPQGLTAAAEGSAINLAWSAGDTETPASFRLYRATYPITSAAGLAYRTLVGASAADTPAEDGIYHYVITALDQPGNESALSAEAVVSYDAAAPVITVTGVQDGAYYNGAVRPAFEASDLNLAAASALLNNAAFVSGAAVGAPGAYTLIVNASDALGHAASKTVNFTIDTASPAITLGGVTAGGVYTSSVTPVISAADAHLSTVTALLNGEPYVAGSAVTASGGYTLQITAADLAGNTALYSAAFTLDLPPAKVGSLAAVVEDGAALALSWAAYGGEVAVYKVYRDGAYLGAVNITQTSYRDTAYTAGAAHTYEVAAVDAKGREGARAAAEIPAVSFSLAGYGNYSGAAQALNRGFFDAVRFKLANNGTQAVQAGPVSLAVGAEAAVSALPASVGAGSAVEISPVVYTSTSSAASVAASAVLTLPQGGDAALSAVINFTMAVRDPAQPIVELYPEALVRGAYARVQVKFNNRGSAPADIITARVSGGGVAASSAVAVTLKTQAGLTLYRGEVLQSTHDVSGVSIDGAQAYFARVEPGSSYVFDPVSLAVPAAAVEELTITGGVYAMAHSLGYQPVAVSPVFEAARTQAAVAVIPYTAVVAPSKRVYDQGEEIVFTGSVQDAVSGSALGNKAVRVMIFGKGFERYLSAVSAADGSFVCVSTPVAGEAGIYHVLATYPYAVSRLAQSSYSITGLELGYTDYAATLAQNSGFTFEVPLINTGETAVDGLAVVFEQVSGSGVTISAVNPPVELAAGARKNLAVTVTAAYDASAEARFTLKLREAHGFERTLPVTVAVAPAQVIPRLTPQAFELGLLAGETRTQSVTVANVGFSTWSAVVISTPTLAWVKVQGPQELGDIGPGQNITFTLLIEPPAGLSNGSYAQNPLASLKSQNYADVALNAGLVVTSARQGNAAFTVINADKVPTDPSRWIGGADVTLTSLEITGLSLKVKSDLNGLARLENVPAGKYAYRGEAAGFNTVSGVAAIEPGLTKALELFLPTSMVTYKWSVTPTSITDKYDITLDMTFRTDVPAPALIASPQTVTVKMSGGQTTYTQYTLTNKGLVSAYDIKITNSGDEALAVESAISRIAELKPGQTVVVPLKVTLAHASAHGGKSGGEGYYQSQCGAVPAGYAVGILAGDVAGGDGLPPRTGGGGGGWSVSGGADYVAVSVSRPAAAKACSSGDDAAPAPGYAHQPHTPPGSCQKAAGGFDGPSGSLGISWWLYYDPQLKDFYETTAWTIEEQPDGSVILTDGEGNQVLFVVKGELNPEVTGACGQYDDVPGYNVELSYSGGRYTVAQKSGNSIEFGAHGGKHKPDVVRDTNNTTLTYAYDAAGRVAAITDIHGRALTFAYDAQGNTTQVSDYSGRQLRLAYDGGNRLVSFTGVDGAEDTYAYGADGRIAAITRANGAHEYHVYDSTGRLTSYSQDNGNNAVTYVYNDVSSTTLATDALGRQTLYEYWGYAGRSEIARVTGPDGGVTEYAYDAHFNRARVKDALGRETAMAYSYHAGNLLSVTDAAGNTTALGYGLGSAANNAAAAVSHVFGAGQGAAAAAGCASSAGTESATMRVVAFDDNGYSQAKDAPYLTSVTDPKGSITRMDYDLNGNLVEVKDALGNASYMSYDQQGHVTATKDPLGNISSFEYNSSGGLAKVTDPLGRVTELTRDNLSRVTRTKDPKNKLTLFEYDVKSNLTKVTDAIGGITQYNYTGGCPSCGGGDLLASVKDAKNQQTTFGYDLQKRLTGTSNPLNQAKTFEYDKKGNLTKVTDAKAQQITFEYDVNDRLAVKHLPNGEGDVTYTYDGVGNLLSVTSQDGSVSMTYGILNRVDQVRQTINSQNYTISYGYDVNGNRTSMSSPWGATSYSYDALNRLTSITNPDNKTITFAYDALGRRTKMAYPNGTETTYAYDAASQLTQILHRKTADNTALAFSNYAYDPAGNRTQMQDLTGTHSYAYDDLHRLTEASHPTLPNETFAYDQVGNRTADAVITNYQHNAANRLLENSSYTYTYDANGNLTGQTHKATSEHTEYAYTTENQLKQVTLPGNTTVTFKYDPMGRRIEKASLSGINRYVYSNEDIIAVLDGNNTITQTITHGPGIDEPLVLKNISGSSICFYHADGLGSIIALSDENGTGVETIEYQAYGRPTIKGRTGAVFDRSTVGNPYLYTGREYDDILGLFYYRARYFSPDIGAFIQEDPINIYGGLNYYRYAGNNPINQSDPLGLKPVTEKSCVALKALVEQEKSGILGKVPWLRKLEVIYSWKFNSLSFSEDITALNAAFDSIYGPVDADWMLRSTLGGFGINPVTAYLTYFEGKFVWNGVVGIADMINGGNGQSPFIGMFDQPDHINAPLVAAKWLWSPKTLEEIFAPALKKCEACFKGK